MSRAEMWRFRRYRGTPRPVRGRTAVPSVWASARVALGIIKAFIVWPAQKNRPARPTVPGSRGIAGWKGHTSGLVQSEPAAWRRWS